VKSHKPCYIKNGCMDHTRGAQVMHQSLVIPASHQPTAYPQHAHHCEVRIRLVHHVQALAGAGCTRRHTGMDGRRHRQRGSRTGRILLLLLLLRCRATCAAIVSCPRRRHLAWAGRGGTCRSCRRRRRRCRRGGDRGVVTRRVAARHRGVGARHVVQVGGQRAAMHVRQRARGARVSQCAAVGGRIRHRRHAVVPAA
jgi:hypothetical protein